MKKTLIFLSVAAVVSLAACQEKPISNESGITSFTATLEQQSEPDGTKTHLDGCIIKWSEDDAIKVFYSDGTDYQFDVVDGVGTTGASFNYSGATTGTPQYAIYPYSAGASRSGSTITFSVSGTQSFAKNGFSNGANVAVAPIVSGQMQFKNVFGILKLGLKGHMKVARIELEGNNNEKLYGTFTVNASDTENPFAEYYSDGGEVLTLDCTNFNESSAGAGDGSVQLMPFTTTNFYFVVPVGSFGDETNGGFTATIYDEAGDSYCVELSTDNKANIINRSRVRVPGDRIATLLPLAYTEVAYIEGNGTQYLDTGLPMPNGFQVKAGYIFYHNGIASLIGSHNTTSKDSYGRNFLGQDPKDGRIQLCCGGSILTMTSINTSRYLDCYHEYHASTNRENIFLRVDGDIALSGKNSGAVQSSNNLFIFGNQYSIFVDKTVTEYGKLYWLKLYSPDGSDLLKYYVPCLRVADSKPGLYDLINNEFLINQAEKGDDFIYATME